MAGNETTERDPETLEIFIEESLEGLTRVEKLLLDAEKGRPPPTMMATLFRDFHTIKGTSGFLALDKIRVLSHAAEDLLSLLRDETIKGGPPHYAVLVGVVDALRSMIDNVRSTNDEGDVNVEPLVQRLNALQTAGAAAEPAAPSPPAEVSAAPAAAAGADEEESAPKAESREHADGTVRVNVGVLDRLINLIGELVLARNQMMQLSRTSQRESSSNNTGQQAYQRLNLVTSDLQEQVMKTRMQPVARVFERIPRMVRDLCKQMGKQVAVHVDGTSTEIDRALVEAIRDPVMHMIRNALDHGIETPEGRAAANKPPVGRLAVRASHEAGTVVIEIDDDGRGMHPDKLRAHAIKKGVITAVEAERLSDRDALDLVFRPGFSTAEKVTDVSGRGVGMDVVRTHVERAGGQVELDSTPGKGTTVRLKMPLTLAIIPALLVQAGSLRFAIPQVNLLELVHLREERAKNAIENVRGALIYRLRGEILPLIRLSSVLALPQRDDLGVSIVVINAGGRRCGLIVDVIHDTEEIVIKPLSGALKKLGCYAGATVLGDGSVALVLDVAGVAQMSGIELTSAQKKTEDDADIERTRARQHLVFTAGDGAACAVPLAMVSRLERIPSKQIERVAGQEVVQYRDRVLPLVRPESVLPLGPPPEGTDQAVIVFDFGVPVGMAVNTITDVTDVTIADEEDQSHPYTLGKAVVFDRTTLVLDVYRLMLDLAPSFVRDRRRQQRRPRVLVADDSEAMRAALTGYLRSAGLDVVDVPSGDAALRELRSKGGYDAVVTDLEMPGTDGFGVIDAVRRERPELPVFVWTQLDDEETTSRVATTGVRACVSKLRREDLITAFEQAGVLARRRAGDGRAA